MKNRLKYLVIVLLIIVFVISFFVWKRNETDLKNSHLFTTATITDWNPSSRAGLFLDYEFKVNGKTFHSSTKDFNLKSDNARYIIGKTFGLVYSPKNPDNNRLLTTKEDFASFNMIQPDSLTKYNHYFD